MKWLNTILFNYAGSKSKDMEKSPCQMKILDYRQAVAKEWFQINPSWFIINLRAHTSM